MTTDFKTDTEVLIIAMRHWAKVVLANGGVAADTISQGADRLQELQARAELAEASAKLWEADALRYANNTEFWKDRAEKAEAELVRLRADLERFTGHGLLDCHAICDQRDSAVSERDQLRAENEDLATRAGLRLSALDYEKLNAEAFKARAEKAEAALTDPQQLHIHCLRTLNEGQISHLFGERMTEIINRAEAAIRSERLWKEFITLMEITEESDSGYEFNPNKISSCRAMDGKRLNEILNEARQIVFKQ